MTILDGARQIRSCELIAVHALGMHLNPHFADRRYFTGQLHGHPRIPAAPFSYDLPFTNGGLGSVAAGRIIGTRTVADGSRVDTIDAVRRARWRRSPTRPLLSSCDRLTSGLFSFQLLVGEAACPRLGTLPLGFLLRACHVRPALHLLRRLFRRDQLLLRAGGLLLGRLGYHASLFSQLLLFLRIRPIAATQRERDGRDRGPSQRALRAAAHFRRRQRAETFSGGNREGPHRLRNVLEELLTKRREGQGQFVPDLVVYAARDTNPPGFGHRLQSRRHVDAVAKKISVLHQDVAEIDTDAKSDLARGRELIVPRAQRRLDLGRATHGLDHAGELREDCVASCVENTSAVQRDKRLEHLLVRPERAERLLLVLGHQAAVLGDVGGQDCRHPAFKARRDRTVGFVGHGRRPLTASGAPMGRRTARSLAQGGRTSPEAQFSTAARSRSSSASRGVTHRSNVTPHPHVVPHPVSWTLSKTELVVVGALASFPWRREIAISGNTQIAAPLIKSSL